MIDWQRVRDLREEIGDDDFSEVAELFVAEVEEVMDRLRGYADPPQLEADLHFLKSSALNLGFTQLAALCQDGERLAASGNPGGVALAPIFDCYEASKSAFLAG